MKKIIEHRMLVVVIALTISIPIKLYHDDFVFPGYLAGVLGTSIWLLILDIFIFKQKNKLNNKNKHNGNNEQGE